MDPAARIVTRSSECTLGKVTSPSAVRLIFHPSLQLSSSSSSSGWAESQDESAPVQNARNFFAAPTSPAKPLINLHVSLPRTSFFGLIFPFPHTFSLSVFEAEAEWMDEPNTQRTCEYLSCFIFYITKQFPQYFQRFWQHPKIEQRLAEFVKRKMKRPRSASEVREFKPPNAVLLSSRRNLKLAPNQLQTPLKTSAFWELMSQRKL